MSSHVEWNGIWGFIIYVIHKFILYLISHLKRRTINTNLFTFQLKLAQIFIVLETLNYQPSSIGIANSVAPHSTAVVINIHFFFLLFNRIQRAFTALLRTNQTDYYGCCCCCVPKTRRWQIFVSSVYIYAWFVYTARMSRLCTRKLYRVRTARIGVFANPPSPSQRSQNNIGHNRLIAIVYFFRRDFRIPKYIIYIYICCEFALKSVRARARVQTKRRRVGRRRVGAAVARGN